MNAVRKSIYLFENKPEIEELFGILGLTGHYFVATIKQAQKFILSDLSYTFATTKALHLTGRQFDWAHTLLTAGDIIPFQSDDIQEARKRLVFNVEGTLSDPPPANITDEILLFLHFHPGLIIEYLGRGFDKKLTQTLPFGLPKGEHEKFLFEIIGGSRKYLWQSHSSNGFQGIPPIEEQLKGFIDWISDPTARVVVSIGSGGLRGIGTFGLFQILDLLQLRSSVHEIWTASGGSFAGYLYSCGLTKPQIERIIYGLYHEKFSALKFNFKDICTKIYKRFTKGFDYSFGMADIREPIRKFTDVPENDMAKIPLYVVSTNPQKHSAQAFAINTASNPHNYPFIATGLTPLDAIHASCSIPYLCIPPLINGQPHWDGVLSEETPLALPTQKWLLDRKNAPETTPKKLKVIYVQIAPRITKESDSRIFRWFPIQEISAFIDCALESSAKLHCDMIAQIPGVEIEKIILEFDRLVFLSSKDYTYLQQQGRLTIISQLLKISSRLSEKKSGKKGTH